MQAHSTVLLCDVWLARCVKSTLGSAHVPACASLQASAPTRGPETCSLILAVSWQARLAEVEEERSSLQAQVGILGQRLREADAAQVLPWGLLLHVLFWACGDLS